MDSVDVLSTWIGNTLTEQSEIWNILSAKSIQSRPFRAFQISDFQITDVQPAQTNFKGFCTKSPKFPTEEQRTSLTDIRK
jgi:hypothetical protein